MEMIYVWLTLSICVTAREAEKEVFFIFQEPGDRAGQGPVRS